jgi:hypothetical protein
MSQVAHLFSTVEGSEPPTERACEDHSRYSGGEIDRPPLLCTTLYATFVAATFTLLGE